MSIQNYLASDRHTNSNGTASEMPKKVTLAHGINGVAGWSPINGETAKEGNTSRQTSGGEQSEFPCSENTAPPQKKRGRPRDPNAAIFRTVGLRPADWDYLMQWRSETDPENPTKALENFLEELRRMAPAPGYSSSRRRDALGRWLPDGE